MGTVICFQLTKGKEWFSCCGQSSSFWFLHPPFPPVQWMTLLRHRQEDFLMGLAGAALGNVSNTTGIWCVRKEVLVVLMAASATSFGSSRKWKEESYYFDIYFSCIALLHNKFAT